MASNLRRWFRKRSSEFEQTHPTEFPRQFVQRQRSLHHRRKSDFGRFPDSERGKSFPPAIGVQFSAFAKDYAAINPPSTSNWTYPLSSLLVRARADEATPLAEIQRKASNSRKTEPQELGSLLVHVLARLEMTNETPAINSTSLEAPDADSGAGDR